MQVRNFQQSEEVFQVTQIPFSVVILAAGKGTRMNSDLPKVLHEIAGRPLILRVLDTANELGAAQTIVVVGHMREMVEEAVAGIADATVIQDPPLGTGHAVLQAEEAVSSECHEVLILSGDVPLLRASTLEILLDRHRESGCELTVLSAKATNPFGYGRIVRDLDGEFTGIVEEKDANTDQRNLSEINSGVYVVNRRGLFWALHRVKPNNAKGEYYLTDIVGILAKAGKKTQAVNCADFTELQGINTPAELAQAETAWLARQAG